MPPMRFLSTSLPPSLCLSLSLCMCMCAWCVSVRSIWQAFYWNRILCSSNFSTIPLNLSTLYVHFQWQKQGKSDLFSCCLCRTSFILKMCTQWQQWTINGTENDSRAKKTIDISIEWYLNSSSSIHYTNKI